MKVAIIGGGAAGFFAAISCKYFHPQADITIYEKTNKLLSKVKVSGGGRCNVTHNCSYPSELTQYYPRGGKQLKKHFKAFNNHHITDWFEQRNTKLKVESDGRIFPVTDSSQTIIDVFLKEARSQGIKISTKSNISALRKRHDRIELTNNSMTIVVDRVIVATGGSNKKSSYDWLSVLGHQIALPVPSLFTFNIPTDPIIKLMGVSVAHVRASIVGYKYHTEGPLLITHWGMSGPAILKLSSHAARLLNELGYNFRVAINWSGTLGEEKIRARIVDGSQKQLKNHNPFLLPQRLWEHIINKSDLNGSIRCCDLSKKAKNKLCFPILN